MSEQRNGNSAAKNGFKQVPLAYASIAIALLLGVASVYTSYVAVSKTHDRYYSKDAKEDFGKHSKEHEAERKLFEKDISYIKEQLENLREDLRAHELFMAQTIKSLDDKHPPKDLIRRLEKLEEDK